MSKPLLEVDDVTMRFGGLTALDDVSFHIDEGEILGLIGPNGAGKTTCFNVITGVYQPTAGEVRFDGSRLAGREAARDHQARHRPHLPEHPAVPDDDGAGERPGRRRRPRTQRACSTRCSALPRHRREEQAAHDEAMELLRFMGLSTTGRRARRRTCPTATSAGSRSPGRWRPSPKLLCLDEPAAGFNPAEKQTLMELIRKVRDRGYTVLLIEHDMSLVMGVTDRIVVLEFGRKIAEGTPAEIRDNPAVIAAYLGVDEDDAS